MDRVGLREVADGAGLVREFDRHVEIEIGRAGRLDLDLGDAGLGVDRVEAVDEVLLADGRLRGRADHLVERVVIAGAPSHQEALGCLVGRTGIGRRRVLRRGGRGRLGCLGRVGLFRDGRVGRGRLLILRLVSRGRRGLVLLLGGAGLVVGGDRSGCLGRVLVAAREPVHATRRRNADARAHKKREENGEDGWPPSGFVPGGVRRVVLRQRRMNSDPTKLAGHTRMRRRACGALPC